MELHGKVALITGAGSGIGAATARTMAAEGADLVLIDRNAGAVATIAGEIQANGGKALDIALDIADEAQMRAAFERVGSEHGHLDIVFANAGINGTWAPVDDLTYAEWNETQRVNLGGTFLTAHFAVPLMKAAGGAITITSSLNGTRTFTQAGASAYSASKAGQLAFGQMLALELAQYRIRVNVICSGAIETNIIDRTIRRNTADAQVPSIFPQGRIPLTRGKRGTPEQVADLVVFLSSDRASHITGTPIWIDGAQSLLV